MIYDKWLSRPKHLEIEKVEKWNNLVKRFAQQYYLLIYFSYIFDLSDNLLIHLVSFGTPSFW